MGVLLLGSVIAAAVWEYRLLPTWPTATSPFAAGSSLHVPSIMSPFLSSTSTHVLWGSTWVIQLLAKKLWSAMAAFVKATTRSGVSIIGCRKILHLEAKIPKVSSMILLARLSL